VNREKEKGKEEEEKETSTPPLRRGRKSFSFIFLRGCTRSGGKGRKRGEKKSLFFF